MRKFKLGLILTTVSLGALGWQTNLLAQDGAVSVSQQSQQVVQKPRNGQSMEQVTETFGEPVERAAAVGEPPITRWRYGQFTVYFEHNRVIHAVAHRS